MEPKVTRPGTNNKKFKCFQVGSSVALNFGKAASNVWKIDDAVEDDLIDEDNLLDEEDILKPKAESLRGISNIVDAEIDLKKKCFH